MHGTYIKISFVIRLPEHGHKFGRSMYETYYVYKVRYS